MERELNKEFESLVNQSTTDIENDEIVLCENGRLTTNTYPLSLMRESDCKSPTDWVKAICFHHRTFDMKSTKLSFIIRKKA